MPVTDRGEKRGIMRARDGVHGISNCCQIERRCQSVIAWGCGNVNYVFNIQPGLGETLFTSLDGKPLLGWWQSAHKQGEIASQFSE